MKCAIYGAGSLGTILGAYLTKAEVDVDLINRNRAHTEALKSGGARVTGAVTMTVPVNALLTEEMTGTYDVIFLLTKQTENRTVVESLKPHLAEGGVICTLQNGLRSLSSPISSARTPCWAASSNGARHCKRRAYRS
jgi:2-dehydropantoate 2-reductase